jgi:AcrR family transcriptional regulator
MPPSADARIRRSRLTPEREQELYDATLALVREAGYDALTMDAVASRTRSSKATLYRQWKSKPKLVVSALRARRPVSAGDIDTGTLAGDLRELVRLAACDESVKDLELLRGLSHAIVQNPDLHDALRELILDPEIDALDAMLRRGVERGELAADNPAAEFVVHMMFGAMVARQLIEDQEPDVEFVTRYLEAVVLPALGLG